MTLPAFKRNPTCPKCGHDGIGFDYKAQTDLPADTERRPGAGCGFWQEVHFEEHIHLVCSRCGYGKHDPWIMGPAENPDRTVGFRLESA